MEVEGRAVCTCAWVQTDRHRQDTDTEVSRIHSFSFQMPTRAWPGWEDDWNLGRLARVAATFRGLHWQEAGVRNRAGIQTWSCHGR